MFPEQFLAQVFVRPRRAEERTFGHDHGAASARRKRAQHEAQEQEFALPGPGGQVLADGLTGDLTGEGRVGEDHLVAPVQVVFGEAAHLGEDVAALEARAADSVEHEVHHGDPHHLARYVGAVDRGLEQVPVGDLLAGPLPVGLKVRDLFFGLVERLPALFEPVLAVDRYVLGFLAVAGEDVVHDVDEKSGRAAGGIVHGVAQIGIDHFDHEGADLARRPELAVQGPTGRGG